jgi:uncharacterized tellurite resistance protein B-like protein
MDILLHKKINILIHLAKADGMFHETEKRMLYSLLEEHNFNPEDFMANYNPDSPSADVVGISGKAELLFWSLKLIQADGIIHPDEVAYCKKIASQLGFKTELVDEYAHKILPMLDLFEKEINAYKLD